MKRSVLKPHSLMHVDSRIFLDLGDDLPSYVCHDLSCQWFYGGLM